MMASVLLRVGAVVVLLGGMLLLVGSVLLGNFFFGSLSGMAGAFNPSDVFWGWTFVLGGLTVAVLGAGVFLWGFAKQAA